MAKTMVGYPDEPSNKALILARIILAGGAAYIVAYRKRDAIGRVIATVAVMPMTVRQLAILLTRLGIV